MREQNWQLPSNFDVMSAENSKCDCGWTYFETVLTLKKVPADISPTKKEAMVPVPVFKCTGCGKIHNDNSSLS